MEKEYVCRCPQCLKEITFAFDIYKICEAFGSQKVHLNVECPNCGEMFFIEVN